MTNRLFSLNHAGRLALFALGLAALPACDDEGSTGPKPPPVTLPDEPKPTYGEGNLTDAQRGIALDEDDFAVLTPNGAAGIGVSELGTSFKRLVVNRPYVDWRASVCVDPDDAATYQPRAITERLISRLEAEKGVTFDDIAVNVDLLSPGRRDLIFVCYGDDRPRFDVPAHRQAIMDAFLDLAEVPGVKSITVGLEMNRYYHLLTDDGRPLVDDYSNYITLYRSIYHALKERHPDLQVGPGVSYAVFSRRTIPEIAEELDLDETGMEAYYRAWQRTIEPLLKDRQGATADFLGVSMIPFQSEAPFDGVPRYVDAQGTEEAAQDDIREHYRRMPVFAGGLPIVLPQIDWASGAGNANLKARYLQSLKNALSGVDIAWAAWRRTSDLPATDDASPCAKYTEAREPTLAYPADYCTAGLVSESGRRREVLDEFLKAE
ncbi:MAG: hypothetical protein R3F60_17440 [bacterium]